MTNDTLQQGFFQMTLGDMELSKFEMHLLVEGTLLQKVAFEQNLAFAYCNKQLFDLP